MLTGDTQQQGSCTAQQQTGEDSGLKYTGRITRGWGTGGNTAGTNQTYETGESKTQTTEHRTRDYQILTLLLVPGSSLQAKFCGHYTVQEKLSDTHYVLVMPSDSGEPLTACPSQHHGPALQEFVEWCDSSKLELNVSKTKEMVVTFSSRQRDLAASYKYLGTIFDNLLKFSANTEEILRRCHQRLYLLRKLNSFGVSTPIMMTFYYAFLESIMTFSFTCWFHSLSLQNRNRLQHTASVCSKIIGLPVRTLAKVISQQALRQAAKIINDPSHILHPAFQCLWATPPLHFMQD
ncbi:hypothetical protein ACER0C_028680 [Sarotherodon galilaeus]